jgi:inhibitor of cysteine peptidase
MRKFMVVILAILVLVVACNSTNDVQLGAGENGSHMAVRKGQVLVVTLESNPTTGYRWEVASASEGILKQRGESEYVQGNPDNNLLGYGGAETFRFDVVGTGEATLKLIYHRTFEQGVAPAQTYEVAMTAR